MALLLTPTSKLQAVNACLRNIGEAPVSSLDDLQVDAQVADNLVDEVSREMQMLGWYFNTETMTMAVDADSKIPVSSATLTADSTGHDAYKNIVMRGGFLYDLDNSTFIFTSSLKAQVVILLGFTDLTEPFRRYVTLRSARILQEDHIGAEELSVQDHRDERTSWASMLDAEAQHADYNIITGSQDALLTARRYYPVSRG